MIARTSYEFPPLAKIRYTWRFLFALAGAALASVALVRLVRTDPQPRLLDLLVVVGAVVGSAWFAWRATIFYDATYSGLTISRAGLRVATYSWTELREWCHEWTVNGDDDVVGWVWLRFDDGRRWVMPESLSRDFRDLRNHLAIHFDSQRVRSRAPLWARFWP